MSLHARHAQPFGQVNLRIFTGCQWGEPSGGSRLHAIKVGLYDSDQEREETSSEEDSPGGATKAQGALLAQDWREAFWFGDPLRTDA